MQKSGKKQKSDKKNNLVICTNDLIHVITVAIQGTLVIYSFDNQIHYQNIFFLYIHIVLVFIQF